MELHNLSNNKLKEQYEIIKEKFIKAEPTDKEITRIYGMIIGEIKKRSFKTFNM